MISHRIRRAAAVLSRFAVAAAFATPPAAGAPPLPNLSGQWHLNKDVSDDPQQKLHPDSEGGSGGSGSGGSSGSGGRGFGGRRGRRGSSGDDGSGTPGPSLFEGRATLTIRHQEPELRITDGAGRERVIYTDGREVEEERSFGGTTKVQARWKDGHVEVTSKPEHGPKTVETYAIAADGTQLTVTTQIDRRRGSAVTIRSVYDPTPPSDKTPPPSSSDSDDIEVTAAVGGAR